MKNGHWLSAAPLLTLAFRGTGPLLAQVELSVAQNFAPVCREFCTLWGGCTVVCAPVPSYFLGTPSTYLAPNASQPFSYSWGAGALPAGDASRSFNFGAYVSAQTGTPLDSAAVTVIQK
jgi:hypothetical protein